MDEITRTPKVYEPELAQEVVDAYPDASPQLRDLIQGVAGSSPYLRGLLKREAAWLNDVKSADLDALPALIEAEVTATTFETLSVALRVAKRRIALLSALADLGGIWSLEQVTGALTDFADFAVHRGLQFLVEAEIARGKLPGLSESDIETAGGMVAIAMGKMGAGELNYSSDIDLIIVFDETRHSSENFEAIRSGFVRITRRLYKLLSDMTSEGYVFRTDLRLRPDPSVTPVCLSMEAALRYYESVGRTWERAAYIKARACAGDIAAGDRFLTALVPFIWRKHLDFAAIQDAHDMRLRIREHKGLGGPITLPGHNMKLGRGGIREIEFFTQTRQIIAGGRDPDLRVRGTIEGLAVLAQKGWVETEVSRDLTDAYIAHRDVEHRLQMIGDAQTHDLPQTDAQFDRLAALSGASSVRDMLDGIKSRLELVHDLTEPFFTPDAKDAQAAPEISDTTRQMIERWREYPALRSARANEIFDRLQPVILARMTRATNPEEALIQFDRFLAGLPSGVQLFSLFEANGQLIDLIVDICAISPSLANYLSRNAGVLEGVISGGFFEPLDGADILGARLIKLLESAADYEDQLNTARRWMKEHHFRIGVQHLRGMITSVEAAHAYSDLADACLIGVFPCVQREFSRRHGVVAGRGAMVLGMGSLGARSLTSTSDLDLIMIYEAGDDAGSDGERPLAVSAYYARLTKALVTALGSPMSDGKLYEVDMRLRPSGRKGPVATSLASFTSYQQNEAWTWEHLALTRARGIVGDYSLMEEVESFRITLLKAKGEKQKTLEDVRDMRRRLDAATSSTGVWEAKQGDGRMLDIEILAQAAALMSGIADRDIQTQLAAGAASDWLATEDTAHLAENYKRLQSLQLVARLVMQGAFDPAIAGQGARALLLAETGSASLDELEEQLIADREKTRAIINAALQ